MGDVNSNAYLGLTKSVGKREQAQKELATMGQLLLLKKQGEAEEQQAIALEEEYYAKIREQADQMLDGDRKAINERVKLLQNDVKEKVRLYGGSRKKFMAGGGQGVLSTYTNDIINSDEVFTYKQNKVNLEKLLDAKSKGFGHRITPKDQLALQYYNEHGRGNLSYSGLLNEIELPPAAQFEFGKRTTPRDLVLHGNNRDKLIQNYLIENPEQADAMAAMNEYQIYDLLESYAKAKGYTQKGTHESPYGNRSKSSSGYDSDYDKNANKRTLTGGIYSILNAGYSTPVSQLGGDTYIASGLMNNIAGNVYEGKFKTSWDDNNVPGVDEDITYRPKGGKTLPEIMLNPAIKTVFGPETLLEDGWVKNVSSSKVAGNFYDGRGYETRPPSKDWSYKPLEIGLAFEAIVDGKKIIIMDAEKDNGEIFEGIDLYPNPEGIDEANANPIMVMAVELKSATGNQVHYVKIPLSGQGPQAEFQKYMDETGANDISGLVTESKSREQTRQQAEALGVAEVAVKNTPIDQPVFKSNVFKMQSKDYNYIEGGTHRDSLRKSFYLTLDYLAKRKELPFDIEKAVTENLFETTMNDHQMYKAVRSSRISDPDLIQLLDKQLNAGNTARDQEPFMETMQMFLQKINNPTTK